MALFTLTKTEITKKSAGFIANYVEASRLRRAEKQLNRMNDRMLEDIGLSRGDVHGKVWGAF